MTEDGFEYQGVFYAWHVSDVGKDLRLIDYFTGMPVEDFFDAVRDDVGKRRGPILLALMATSVRHTKPDWSVDKVARLVDCLSLSDVDWVGGEGDDDLPPTADSPQNDELSSPPTSSRKPNESQESPTSEQSSVIHA
jgi:hypothetical protein